MPSYHWSIADPDSCVVTNQDRNLFDIVKYRSIYLCKRFPTTISSARTKIRKINHGPGLAAVVRRRAPQKKSDGQMRLGKRFRLRVWPNGINDSCVRTSSRQVTPVTKLLQAQNLFHLCSTDNTSTASMVQKVYVTYNQVRTASSAAQPHYTTPLQLSHIWWQLRSLTFCNQVHKHCQNSAERILNDFKPNLMIAIGGGGYVPARILRYGFWPIFSCPVTLLCEAMQDVLLNSADSDF